MRTSGGIGKGTKRGVDVRLMSSKKRVHTIMIVVKWEIWLELTVWVSVPLDMSCSVSFMG